MPAKRTNESSLKNAWLRQLQKEYVSLLWRYNFKVPLATLEFNCGQSVWGQWKADERRITINEKLIEHGWQAVLGILGHEVAHQLVWELHRERALSEAAHGPAFKLMASALNLHPFYQDSKVDFINNVPHPPAFTVELEQPKQKILEKVQKLFALGNSPVLAESQAAMVKAFELMSKHNLELLETETAQGYVRQVIALESRIISSHHSFIGHILSSYFFVEVIAVSGYNPHKDCEEKFFELFGRPENVKLAEHIFHFLSERTETLWQARRKEVAQKGQAAGGQRARFAFMLGVLQGFEQKLSIFEQKDQKANTQQQPPSAALILAQDLALKKFVAKHHPKLKNMTRSSKRIDRQNNDLGRNLGRNLEFHKPIENETNSKGQSPKMVKYDKMEPR